LSVRLQTQQCRISQFQESAAAVRGRQRLEVLRCAEDPQWKDDPDVKRYVALLEKYYSEGDKSSNFNTYAYGAAQLLVHVLQQCGDDLTRGNVMRRAASLKNVTGDLSLPGITINTSPTDHRLHKRLQMMRFNGERWELFGPILENAGRAG
jgi:branched-chain amino acid transport system substrate-binding protein